MPWSNEQTRTSTAAHKAWAREVKRRAGGRCQGNEPGCTGEAQHADHKVPVAEGGAEHDVDNGQALCDVCHAPKTAAETQRGRERFYGAARRPQRRHPGV